MWGWVRKLSPKKPAPLAGAPLKRRQKSYSAQSGCVYLYQFQGQREAKRRSEPATEYVFDVSSARETLEPVSVFLARSSISAWEDEHHPLSATERYAVAKMALFQAFDERENPRQMRQAVIVRRADAECILETLGIV
jgi:hypothetical protein